MSFDHIYLLFPISFQIHILSPPTQLCASVPFLFLNTLSFFFARNILLDVWACTGAGVKHFKQTDYLSPSGSQWSVAHKLGLGIHAHIPSPYWDCSGLSLHGSCPGSHNLCEFLCIAAMPYPENFFLCNNPPPPTPSFCSHFHQHACTLGRVCVGYDIDINISFGNEHSLLDPQTRKPEAFLSFCCLPLSLLSVFLFRFFCSDRILLHALVCH